MAGASDAFAQRRGYGGGWGNSPGISIGIGRGSLYSPYGYGNNGYYGNSGYGSFYGNTYPYGSSYYGSGLGYSLSPQTYDVQPQQQYSYYSPATPSLQSAALTVLLPNAGAQVWFQGVGTSQQGMERLFHSPPLEPNHAFVYTIKARWTENGQAIDQERQVSVQAGQNITVNFRQPTGEIVPSPR